MKPTEQLTEHYDIASDRLIFKFQNRPGERCLAVAHDGPPTEARIKARLQFYRTGTSDPWAVWLRNLLPRRVADRLQFAVRQDDTMYIWWYDVAQPIYFSYSDDFPTELDIARLCVECP